MKSCIRHLTVSAILSAALFSTVAWSQQTPPATTPSPQAASASAAPKPSKQRADVVEQRITDLHGQLKVTDQQSRQWDAFTATMRDNARKTDAAFRDRAQKLPAMDADDAMKSYAALAQQHSENMQKLSSSFSDLYAVLSPEQKQVADAMYRNQQARKAASHGAHKHGKSAAPASAASAG